MSEPRNVTAADGGVGCLIILLFYVLGFAFTGLPWLIGIAWMANHWLGVGG